MPTMKEIAGVNGALTGLVILAVLLVVDRRDRPAGYLAGLFFVLYAVGRFLVEFVRWHEPALVATTVGGVEVTTYQVICLGLFAVGAYLLLSAQPAGGQDVLYGEAKGGTS